VETYFFGKINIYVKLTRTFIFDSFILELMFLNYIIFMLFSSFTHELRYFYTKKMLNIILT